MFDAIKTVDCIKNLIGFKNHYDLTEIPELSTELTISQSGEYINDAHPAMRLDLIKSTLPTNRKLNEYLKSVRENSIKELLNELYTEKALNSYARELVKNDIIHNSQGFIKDTVINESRFVGVMFKPNLEIGLKAVINRIGLQFTGVENNLKLYVYHSNKQKPLVVLEKKDIDQTAGQFNWIEFNYELSYDDSDLSGGYLYIGYYQNDVETNAINYQSLDWKTGYCRTCDGGVQQGKYDSIARFMKMRAFYVPPANIKANRDIFDADATIDVTNRNFGFNFNISINCDLTNFFCDNRRTLTNALKLKVVQKILKDISYSQEINHIEEQLKMMIIRDLEGDKETNYININQQYQKALKAINLNHSGLNSICLPVNKPSGIDYSVN